MCDSAAVVKLKVAYFTLTVSRDNNKKLFDFISNLYVGSTVNDVFA